MYVDDVYRAGELADGLGHYVRVMIVRILREKKELSIRDLRKEILNRYGRDIPYSTLLAHAKKLVLTGICEEKKINDLNGIKLVHDVEVVLWEK